MSFKKSKSQSILLSIVIYLIAIAVSFFVFNLLSYDISVLPNMAIADLIATIFIFCGSVLLNNSSNYDPYWSVKPMAIALGFALMVGFDSLQWYHWVTFFLVQLYGLRLTINFYRDWVGFSHEDWRYVNFRKQFPKTYWLVSLGGIHLFPTVMVFLSCLPLYAIFKSSLNPNILIFSVGALVLLGSVALAYVADEQMRAFRQIPENKGKFINEKLWKYSRHPNYLGEILTWWGLYIMALSFNIDYWWTGIGALCITLMFIFVSIPLLDKRSLIRRENFEFYMNSTSKLLILPKKKLI